MSIEQEPQSIRDRIEQKIQEGRVAMRPRWHFVLRTILTVLGVVLVLLVGLYLVSFVVFVVRTSDIGYLPGFGIRGIGHFLFALPWYVIGVAFLFVMVLEVLVRRYAFSYRRPLLYTVIGGLLFTTLGGVALAYYTPLHIITNRLPIVRPMYQHYETLPVPQVRHGKILTVPEDESEVRIERPGMMKSLRIRLNTETARPRGRALRVGDDIVIFGEQDGEEMRAFDIHRIEE